MWEFWWWGSRFGWQAATQTHRVGQYEAADKKGRRSRHDPPGLDPVQPDSRRYVERAVMACVEAKLHVWMGMPIHQVGCNVKPGAIEGSRLEAIWRWCIDSQPHTQSHSVLDGMIDCPAIEH